MSGARKISDFFSVAGKSESVSKPERDIQKKDEETEMKSMKSANPPPHQDIGLLNPNDLLDDNLKTDLLSLEWKEAHRYDFPTRYVYNRPRKFNSSWIEKHPWMRYSVSKDAVYCVCCVLFGTKDSKDKLFINPVSDWVNFANLVKRHERVDSAHHGCQMAAESYLCINRKEKDSVIDSLSKVHKDQVLQNRHVLEKIIEVLILCGRQNIPIRGHTEEKSNFMAILHLKACDDEILSQHLSKVDSKAKYTSPDVQNELLNLCYDQLCEQLVQDCNKAGYFTVLADECTDKSTKEQLTVCLRFLDFSNGKAILREDFLCFVEAERTTGQKISELILAALENRGVNVENMRGQGYDGASNMSGKHNGVQARIKERVPAAAYVHCKSHQLNLAIVHSSNIPCVRTMMGTVQDIAFAFNYSAKKLLALQEALESSSQAREQLDRKTKIQSLCETRWSSRADSLFTFKSAFPAVVSALEMLEDDGDEKAGSRLASILRFEFLIALVVAQHILSATVPLTNNLQSTECDLVEAVKEAKVVIQMFHDERNDDMVWDELFDMARDLAAPYGIEPKIPRRTGRQIHRANYQTDDPKNYWKFALYYPFMDHLTSELETRLLENEGRFLAQFLIPSNLQGLTGDIVSKIHVAYSGDIGDIDEFKTETQRWKIRWGMETDKPKTLLETLGKFPARLHYPSIQRIIRILLTMPVSTATAERSFSAMKRIKTYLRSTMTTERLSSLSMLHIHREKDVNVQSVVDKFANAKERRLLFK